MLNVGLRFFPTPSQIQTVGQKKIKKCHRSNRSYPYKMALAKIKLKSFFTKWGGIYIIFTCRCIINSIQMEKNLNASMKISESSQAKKKCEKVVNSDSVNGFSDLFDQQIDKGIQNFSLISQAENKNEQLSQNLLLIQWDAANIQKLFDAYDSIGPKWRLIAQIFGSKSENLGKNKFHLCLKKFLRKLNNFIKQKVYKHKKLIKYESIIHILNTSDPQYQMPETMKMWNIEIRKKIFCVAQKIALETNVADECLEWLMININKYNIDTKSYRWKKAKPIQIKKEKISEKRFLAKSGRGQGKANAARSIDQIEQDAEIVPNEFEGSSAILNNQISDPGQMHDFKFLIFDKDLANERTNNFGFVFDSNNSKISRQEFDRFQEIFCRNTSGLNNEELLI